MKLVCLNGEWVPQQEASVSIFDHGLLYGDGVFEGIRVYNGRVFKLEEHVRRLYDSARTILLDIPMSQQAFGEAIVETCARNQLRDGYIRAVVTRGRGDLGLDPRKCPKPTWFVIADAITLYPAECYEHGLKVITCTTRRNSPTALDPAVKSLNYLNNILARIEVNQAGAEEGLMLNQEGLVAEATGDNIFLVRDGILYTPPIAASILRGVTRDTVMDLARAEGIPIREELFSVQFVYNSEECFLTGSAAEVIPVREVDGRKIGDGRPGAVTQRLIAAFHTLVASEGTPIPLPAAEGA